MRVGGDDDGVEEPTDVDGECVGDSEGGVTDTDMCNMVRGRRKK